MMIDSPGKIPDIYKGSDPHVSEFEKSLWQDFWKLYDDKSYREAKGVRALGGHGLWGPFQPRAALHDHPRIRRRHVDDQRAAQRHLSRGAQAAVPRHRADAQ